MRLKQYINESFDKTTVDIDKVVKSILSDCKPYLKEWKSNKFKLEKLLVRGISSKKGFLDKKTRTHRVPKDTDDDVSLEFDHTFYKKFKKHLRSSTVFCELGCIPDSAYGETYLIFPQGNYGVYHSYTVNDLYSYLDNEGMAPNSDEFINIIDYSGIVDTYSIKKLKDINDCNEIMLDCKKYYALNVDWITVADFTGNKIEGWQNAEVMRRLISELT